MFDWLEPRCPLATGVKLWTESRMRWLAEKLGFDRVLRCEVVLPEHRFFPDPYAQTPDDARRIFDRVCGYMKLDPSRFHVSVQPTAPLAGDVGEYHGAVGLYSRADRPCIVLAESLLADPERLVATVAHELAHDILLGGGLITVDEEDHEPLADLVPVFLGLGVFLANAPVRDRSYHAGNWEHFQIDKQGYLPSRIVGYALALFAFARGEVKPDWARHLRPDAAQPFKEGLRYLLKTGDSLFHPDSARRPVRPPSEFEMVDRLTHGSPTVRAMTLRDVAARSSPPVSLLEPVMSRLRDRDADVQIEATWAVASFGHAARGAVSDLVLCLHSHSTRLRASAVAALLAIGAPTDQLVPELTALLQDPDPQVLDMAASALTRLASSPTEFAPSIRSAVPALVAAIRKAGRDCNPCQSLVAALVAIDPSGHLAHPLLDSIEPSVRSWAIRSLHDARLVRERDREI